MVSLLLSTAKQDPTERFAKFLRARNQNGETCLHEAVRCKPIESVQLLIMEDAELEEGEGNPALVKIVDNEGVSPLYLATTLKRIDVVRILTQTSSRHSASFAGPTGKTALHAAVCLGKEMSEQLVNWNKGLINETDESGSTPLHLLGSRGHPDIAKVLLGKDKEEHYSAAHCPDSMGRLPIHAAAANGRLKVIKLLFEECPDCMWSCDAFGRSFLHVAVQEIKYNVVEYVCRCRDPRFAEILNMRDDDGNTALHLAVQKGNQWIFLSLMRRREVCLDVTNKGGSTPLDLALLSFEKRAGIYYALSVREWIFHDLILCGANFGICRLDDLVRKVPALDKEAKSKIMSKSGGLMAICAALMLNVAFAAPWNVVGHYNMNAPNAAAMYETMSKSEKIRAHALKAFIISDAIALVSSTLTLYYCTYAGFSIVDSGTRAKHYFVGNVCLYVAYVATIAVFALGVYVLFAPIDLTISVLVCVLATAALIISSSTPFTLMLLHTRTLCSRLGTFPALMLIFSVHYKAQRWLVLGTLSLISCPLLLLYCIVLLSFL